ncbi:amidase domain-containing protein [Agromyces sp. SYSU T00194]|uniref:amidase domain-containing protein n=1 Tax=Agromyces chitinivorans TaxID=3158560 RepID=UPI00339282F3
MPYTPFHRARARIDGGRAAGTDARHGRHLAPAARRATAIALPSTAIRRVLLATAAFGTVAACAIGATVTGAWAAPESGRTLTAAAQASLQHAEIAASVTPAPSEPVVFAAASVDEVPVTGGTEVEVTGTDLSSVAAVAVDGDEVSITDHADDAITFEMPASDAGRTGDVDVTFLDADGDEIPVVDPVAAADHLASVAGTDLVATIIGDDGVLTTPADTGSGAASADASAADAGDADASAALVLTYVPDPGIERQMAYVMKHWNSYNSAEYIVISGADCANFASQSLAARGWTMDKGWGYSSAGYTPSWISSTALRDYLASKPDRATDLGSDRSEVKVGDIAQFDWDNSGDRDHTTIVSRVEHTSSGTKIWVAGHTKDSDYWSVDEALANSGGSVQFWSIH